MKNKRLVQPLFLLTIALAIWSPLNIFSQTAADGLAYERRPFDFTDKFYEVNGIAGSLLVERRDGADGLSVVDFVNDSRFRNVRITETRPAYGGDGQPLLWNRHAGVPKSAFLNNLAGRAAASLTLKYPIYVFPSSTAPKLERQAPMINADAAYFEENRTEAAAFVIVEYTSTVRTLRGQTLLASLAKANGQSLDGSPIIRTVQQLEDLTAEGLVTQRMEPFEPLSMMPVVIAKVIRDTDFGAITPDAFLEMVTLPSGKPLDGEAFFVEYFECLKAKGSGCR